MKYVTDNFATLVEYLLVGQAESFEVSSQGDSVKYIAVGSDSDSLCRRRNLIETMVLYSPLIRDGDDLRPAVKCAFGRHAEHFIAVRRSRR